MSELRLLSDLRWPCPAAVGIESERALWKEARRGMNVLRGRLLLVMEPWRFRAYQKLKKTGRNVSQTLLSYCCTLNVHLNVLLTRTTHLPKPPIS